MASHIKNSLKQLLFYRKTIKPRVKEFTNAKLYEPLAGSSYISLPEKLNNSMKGLINIKNKDLKCFMWCHVRLINPTNRHPEIINK